MALFGSYITEIKAEGEEIKALAQIHWFIFAKPVCFWVLAALMAYGLNVPMIGAVICLPALGFTLMALIYFYTTELAITNRRVIAKFGLIARHTTELRRDQIESLSVSQSIFGRVLNYGTISVLGTGTGESPMHFITAPIAFKKALEMGK